MAKLSDFIFNSVGGAGQIQMTAGAAMNQGDLAILSANGLAYSSGNVDAASQSAATGALIAPTTVSTGNSTVYMSGGALAAEGGNKCFNSDGTFVIFSVDGSGMKARKFSSAGVLLLTSAIIDSYVTTQYSNLIAFTLSNGNLMVSFTEPGGVSNACIILDSNLNVVKSKFAFPATAGLFFIFKLTGGGFMVLIQVLTTNVAVIVYDNTGTVSVASTVIATTTSLQDLKAYELSNLNVVVAIGDSVNSRFIVLSPAAAIVVALTTLASYATNGISVGIASNGFFAISYATGASGAKAWASYSNAGVAQGTPFAFATAIYISYLMRSDGAGNFFTLYYSSATSRYFFLRFSSANPSLQPYVVDIGLPSGVSAGSPYISAYENGNFIVYFYTQTGSIQVINAATGIISNGGTPPQSTASAAGFLLLGDFSYLITYDNQTSYVAGFAANKYFAASIQGVVQAAAAAGGLVIINPIAGSYSINPLKGSAQKAFDHTAATPIGAKGILYNNGVVTRGL
jgi:hypothetical protein